MARYNITIIYNYTSCTQKINRQLTSVIDGTLPFSKQAVDVLAEAAQLVSVGIILSHSLRRHGLLLRRSTSGEGRGHVRGGRDRQLAV